MQFIARKINGEIYVSLDQVNKAIEEKDAEIEKFKADIRRLKRALYKVCFNWAHFAVSFFAEYRTKEKWRKMENKCLAKADLYK